LVPTGREVVQGDRLLELSAGDVAVDLPSPATGRLLEKHVAEGEEVEPDRVLAIIETCDEGGGSE
jgi:pyruvate/2-oxoglutarate dehydrogenase complex dihydrolipoamide acyltransferase (E2) component